MTARVALATSAEALELGIDEDALLLQALAALDVLAELARWDDPAVAWASYDLVVVRSTWDYTWRLADYLAWAASVPRLANPLPVLRWNTDKTYLRDLQAAGVPVVPTTFVAPGQAYDPPAGEVVVKPTVSAGARDTQRFADARDGAALVARLHAEGRTAMVQPYVAEIDDAGETSVVLVDGAVSHGARKRPLLLDGVAEEQWWLDAMSPREPTAEEVAVAHAAVAAVPGDEVPLYARVDLVPGPDGPRLMELELTEPSLSLELAPGSPDVLARAVRSRAAAARPR